MESTLAAMTIRRGRTPDSRHDPRSHKTTLWVDRMGRILDCCEHAQAAFGYCPDELIGSHISTLVPGLAHTELLRGAQVNPRLAFRCRCATFRTLDRNGVENQSSLFVNVVGTQGRAMLAIVVDHEPPEAGQSRSKAVG